MKKPIFALFSLCVIACFSQIGHACECSGPSQKLTKEEIRENLRKFNGAVFVGEVIRITEVEEKYRDGEYYIEREVKFKVEKQWKGIEAAEVVVRTGVGAVIVAI